MATVTESRTYSTPDEIKSIARNIWEKVKQNPQKSDEDDDRLLEQIQAEFVDFNQSFPIVVRWMVQMRRFSFRAFDKFLMKHANRKLSSREDFLELQVEYLVLLHREDHPHESENVIKKYRSNLVQQLLDEDKLFVKISKEVEAEMEQKNKEYDEDRRLKLMEYIKNRVRNE